MILISLQLEKIGMGSKFIIRMLHLIFYMFPLKQKKTEIAYKSKYNLVRDNQVILLLISNGKN